MARAVFVALQLDDPARAYAANFQIMVPIMCGGSCGRK
jgi:hypothetical protein